MGPKQVLWAKVDLGVMAVKGSSTFPKAPVDCLMSYPGYALLWSYPSAKMQLVYSTAQADSTSLGGGLTPLQRCSWYILQPKLTGQCNLVSYSGHSYFFFFFFFFWGVLSLCRGYNQFILSPISRAAYCFFLMLLALIPSSFLSVSLNGRNLSALVYIQCSLSVTLLSLCSNTTSTLWVVNILNVNILFT